MKVIPQTKWEWFDITSLFKIEKGERLVKTDRIDGEVPLITASSKNNGIVDFLSKEVFKEKKKTFDNKITIDMFFNTFYQDEEYFSDDNVHTLIPLFNKNNLYIMLFLLTILRQSAYKYGYGRQLRIKRLELEKIKLPADEEGNPDWKFMEKYMRELSKKVYFDKKVKKVSLRKVETKNWEKFVIGALFKNNFKRGMRLIEIDRTKGDIQYYSASSKNNGLTDMIANPIFIEKDALIYSTFGDSFYVEGEFTASDEITILKHPEMNKYNGLFIATILKENKYKYGFGRKAFLNKLLKDTIKLPADEEGNPDWKFMEKYIKSLPYSKTLEN